MSIETDAELQALLRVGAVVSRALRAMQQAIEPGMTTAELDAVCEQVLKAAGARATPQHVYGFPGAACISINDELVHGVPGDRRIERGASRVRSCIKTCRRRPSGPANRQGGRSRGPSPWLRRAP